MLVKNITLTLGKMSMDEIQGKQTAPADEMVQTLDGRIVNKKEIKNGEIYINAQGKKVRKVIKKVVKSSSNAEGTPLDAKISETKPEGNSASENTPSVQPSVLPEPKSSSEAKSSLPEPKKMGGSSLSEPKKTGGASLPEPKKSAEVATPAEPELSQKIDTAGDLDFRERLSSRHSFLQRMRAGGSVSVPATPSGARNTSGATQGGSASKGGKKGQEEEIAVDKSVSELEEAVLNENYQESVGKNGQKTTGQGRSSAVSGRASNPRGNVLNNPLSNADNDIARGLAGSYSLAQPKTQNTVTLAKPKKKKVKKPLNLWIPASLIAVVYIIICGIYFITNYNFSQKTVSIGEYFLNAGANSKTEYYDGERFNFFEVFMTYDYGEDNVQNIDMSKINLTTRANTQKTMGYTLNNGYISARWEGEYATANKREVNVEFQYGNEIGYIPITIYRNRLESLSGQGSVVLNGDNISVLIWGNYTNDLVTSKKADPLPQRKLAVGEYSLTIIPKSGSQFTLTADNIDTEKQNENVDTYKVPSSKLSLLEDGIDRIEVKSTESSSIKSEIYKTFGTSVVIEVNSKEEEYNNSLGFRCVDYSTEEDINSGLVALNDSLKFKIELKEGFYKGDNFKVEYAIEKYNSTFGRYVEIPSEDIIDGLDGNSYFRIKREEITGNVKIKVSGVTNVYPIYFLVLNNDGEYEIDENKTILVEYNKNEEKTIQDAEDYSGHTFEGWKEATNLTANSSDVSYISGGETKKFSDMQYNFSMASGKARYYYAQYKLNEYNVKFGGNGFTFSGKVTHLDKTTTQLTIQENEEYSFTEGDTFKFVIIGNNSLTVDACYIYNVSNGWTTINATNNEYAIQLGGTSKITGVFASAKYKISSTSPFVEYIKDSNGKYLYANELLAKNLSAVDYSAGILTEPTSENYTVKIKLVDNEHIKINEVPNSDTYPIFEGLTYISKDETTKEYTYTISRADIQNLVLNPENVYAELPIKVVNGSGGLLSDAVTIASGGSPITDKISTTDFSSITLTITINEEKYQIIEGSTLAVTVNGSAVEVTSNSITLTSDMLKSIYNGNSGSGNIIIELSGIEKIESENPSDESADGEEGGNSFV